MSVLWQDYSISTVYCSRQPSLFSFRTSIGGAACYVLGYVSRLDLPEIQFTKFLVAIYRVYSSRDA